MTRITGTEPKHWHGISDDGVHHRLKDPRTYRGYPRRQWTEDERAYVAHLEAHEQGHLSVDPLSSDPELVRACLAHIASEEIRLAQLRALTLALRQELARGVSPEQSEAARELDSVLPELRREALQAEGTGDAQACAPA